MSALGELRATRPPVPWEVTGRVPAGADPDRVWIGADPHGLGFEVALAWWRGAGAPTQDTLRTLHSARLRNRAIPLCVVAHDAQDRAWVLGPMPTAPVLGPVPSGQAARLMQAALMESSSSAARSRVLKARDALETAEIPGFDSQGLFAIRELTWGVPQRADWADACERGREIMATSPRGTELVRALGFESHGIAGNALLLTVGDEPPRAVAILLNDDESFDAESNRFGRSPIYHGLDIAQRNNVRWLVVARGSQLRLYPTAPNVGVGRRGATQTYFGLDLALLDDEHAGYVELAFSGRALAPGGSVDEMLDGSRDYAVDLGKRLRERIYEKVVDTLSIAVAQALAADGPLDEARLADAYRLTLRILFRLLFQAYAEDTRLLPLHRNERYTRESLKELARDLAKHPDHPHDPSSTSLWDGLQQVWRVIDSGDAAWGVPAYNGGLFGSDPVLHPDGAAIARLVLHNDAVGPALAGLLVDETVDRDRGPVDFRSLDVRDFGTIYEGLLESGMSLAREDLTVDAMGAWRPASPREPVDARAGTPYFHTKSGERKATGSYFTKPVFVEHLLEHALDPAIDAHLERVAELADHGDQVGAARLFFDFRVADLAMGSGHFLVAAISHIEAKFGAFLETHPIPGVERELLELRDAAMAALSQVGVEEPELDRSALLGRQIARRCVYGIDINDTTVLLARLAIWVRTFVPGLPLSSLDHQLITGNSLTGIASVEEAMQALEGNEQPGAITFSGSSIRKALDEARDVLEDATALKESTSEETRAAQVASQRALATADPARRLFDTALAVRTGAITVPAIFDAHEISVLADAPPVRHVIGVLAPVHFPLQFPEVFLRAPSGFDVVVGNPPWEKLHVKEDVWWSIRFPGLMTKTTSERDTFIAQVSRERPDLVHELEREKETDTTLKGAISAGPYPGIGAAHIDLFAAFAWRNWHLIRTGGVSGLVLPRTALSGSSLSAWRDEVLDVGSFDDTCFVTNTGKWAFTEVHPQYTFGLVTISRTGSGRVTFNGPFRSMHEYSVGRDTRVEVRAREFTRWSSTAAFPLLPDADASDVFLQMRRQPRFDDAVGFSFRPVQGDMNITTARSVFNLGPPSSPDEVPVLAGGSINLWAPDHAEPYGHGGELLLDWLVQRAVKGSSTKRSPYSGQTVRSVADLAMSRPRIAFRQIARPTDSRTSIACLVPPRVALASGLNYLHRLEGNERDEAYLLGVMSSIPFDWYVRRWVELNFTFELLAPMPVPRPSSGPIRRRIEVLAGQLASVDDRFSTWASAVGVEPGLTTKGDRDSAISELDALVAHSYSLSRQQVEHVFATFHRGWDHADRMERVLVHYDSWAAKSR